MSESSADEGLGPASVVLSFRTMLNRRFKKECVDECRERKICWVNKITELPSFPVLLPSSKPS